MDTREALFFRLLDRYARSQHQCFVAEMNLSRDTTEYAVCFRPTDVRADSSDRYACRYLRITMEEAEIVMSAKMLTARIKKMFDQELPPLHKSDPDS